MIGIWRGGFKAEVEEEGTGDSGERRFGVSLMIDETQKDEELRRSFHDQKAESFQNTNLIYFILRSTSPAYFEG